MVNIRSHPAKALLAAVSECISQGEDLDQLNTNGASFVSVVVVIVVVVVVVVCDKPLSPFPSI